jgi:hypothetical protein
MIKRQMFLTEPLGYPIVTTGQHMVNINKNTTVVAEAPNNNINQEHLDKEAHLRGGPDEKEETGSLSK